MSGTDKTKWIFNDDDGDTDNDQGFGEFTETIDNTQADAGYTTPMTQSTDQEPTTIAAGSDKTIIAHGAGVDHEDDGMSGMSDPVVGWVVVIKGPGQGQSITLGAGMNSLGRDRSERVSLPFGDKTISGKDHSRILYDDDSRSFHIAHGSGKNITKVNGQMVGNILPLENGATIELSKTTHLRFVSFCSEEFDWADLTEDG